MRTRRTLVFALGLSLFMVALGSNIVVVVLPTIAAGFAATPGEVQWVVLGYLLTTLALLIPVGRWIASASPPVSSDEVALLIVEARAPIA